MSQTRYPRKSAKKPSAKKHTGYRQDGPQQSPPSHRQGARQVGGNTRRPPEKAPFPKDTPPFFPAVPTGNPHGETDQEEDRTSLLPGVKPVLELLEHTPERVDCVFLRKGRHGQEADAIIDICRERRIRFSLLDSAAFARVYEGKSQGVVARLFSAGYTDYDTLLDTVMDAPLPLILALDQIQDPGNAGTLVRTLYALGGAGMIAPKHNGVYLGPAAAKAAAGALDKLPISKVGNLGTALDKAKKLGFTVYGAAFIADKANAPADADAMKYKNIFDFTPRVPAILVLGGEENGIRAGMEKRCDFFLSIPMLRDFDSLNVAQAGAILLAQFASFARKG